jgi:hypothetical protein
MSVMTPLAAHLAFHVRATDLDPALARGAPPSSDPARTLRAERLTRPAERRRLARALRRITRGGRFRTRVPTRQDAVQDARP